MQNDWATENLQTIRNLMERAALYRRAMAPMMITIGLTGMAAAGVIAWLHFSDIRALVGGWMLVAVLAFAEALWFARREALKQKEPVWSLPTRRVLQALLPTLLAGFVAGVPFVLVETDEPIILGVLLSLWLVLYGCGLHAAGFFMPRGFKLFGWILIVCGCTIWISLILVSSVNEDLLSFFEKWESWLMGLFFGGGHLAYGIYLYVTEKRGNAT